MRSTTMWCTLAASMLLACAGGAGATSQTESCDAVSAAYQTSIKTAITNFNTLLVEAQSRLSSRELQLIGAGQSLSFINTQLATVSNYTSELSNLLDEVNDVTASALNAALPTGANVTCNVGIDVANVYLSVALNVSGTTSLSVDLSGLPTADVAALGLSITDPAVSLDVAVEVAGTLEVDVMVELGTVAVRVSDLSATISASGSVDTTVAWTDVGTVGLSGAVALTGVTVPLEFPSGSTLSEFLSKVGEVRLGTVSGALLGQLSVDVAVDAVPVGQLPSPVLTMNDTDIFDTTLPTVTVDMDISSLQATVVELLTQLGSFNIDLSALGLADLEVADVDVSAVISGMTDLLQLAPVAEQYFLLHTSSSSSGEYPTFEGLALFLRENLPAPQAASGSLDFGGANITGGWYPEKGEVQLNLQVELDADIASLDFSGSIQNVLGDMQALDVLFDLIGASAPAMSLSVPDMSASVVFGSRIVLDVTLGLKTSFINTGTLTGSALAGNAFVRVNDLSAAVSVEVDPINFEAELPLDSQLEVRDGSFRMAFGVRAAFDATTDDDDVDYDTPVTASTVAAVAEMTVLQLLTGGTTAVLDFIKQLSLEVYTSLDVVIPVELTSGFQGADLSVSPIVELHDDNLLSGGLPSFSLDIDLSLLVPSLPGGIGASSDSTNHVSNMMGSLTTLLDEISGISLPTVSLPGAASLPDLLKSIGGALDFGSELNTYLDLLVKFRELDTGLSLDLSLDLRPAELLLATDAFQTEILGLLKAAYPTVFSGFSDGLTNPTSGVVFSAVNYLKYFQVVFGEASTIASADASWGEADLTCYLAAHGSYALTAKNARAFVRLLGVQDDYPDTNSDGYPATSGGVAFDPASHLDALRDAVGESGTFTLGSLAGYLCSRSVSFGVNVNFQKAIFALVSVRFPDVTAAYTALTVGDALPYNPLTGDVFDWRNYLTEVGTVLGLGSSNIALTDIADLLGKRPTIQGLVRFLKARLLDGLSTSLSVGGLSFSGGLTTGSSGGMELSAVVGLAFETPAVTASEVVASLEEALTGLFELIGVDSVIGSIADIGAGLQDTLSGLDDTLSFGASVSVTVEAGADISPLIDGTGSTPLFYVRVTEFNFAIVANVTDFSTALDFGDPFTFTGICSASLAFRAESSVSDAAPAVLLDDAAGVDSFSLTPLTDSLTLTGSVVGSVELAGGPLDSSLYLGVEDYALFDDVSPSFTVDAEIPYELMVVLKDALTAVGDLGREVNALSALSTTVPLMNRTLNDLLKTDDVGPDWGDYLIWDTAIDEAIASSSDYTDCLASSAGKCPTARETLSALKTRMEYLTTAAFVGDGNDTVPVSAVRAGLVGNFFELGFAVSGTLEIAVTPPLAELIDDDEIEFSGTGLLVVSVSFGLAVDVKVNTTNGLSSVTASDITVQVNNFTMGMEIVADVSATAQLGILEASIDGGEGTLLAAFSGALNGGAATALSDITSSKFSFTKSATVDACLPFSASIGEVDLGSIADDGAGTPQICVTDTDLFDSTAPTVSALYMSRLYDFRGLSPIQIMGIVRGLINTVQEYRESPVFDVSVPFTDVDLGDMLDFSDTLTDALYAKMVKVQDAADRTTLVLCVEGDALPDGWATDGSEGRDTFTNNLDLKVFSVVLNEELQVELSALDAASIEGAATASDLAELLNSALYAAGLGLSVEASVVEGADAIQLCTNESIAATDVRIGVGLKQTGNAAYNESTTAYAPSAMLGFADGAVKEAPRVPAFSSIAGLVEVLAAALGISEDILEVTYAARAGEPTQYELLFAVSLPLTLPSPTASLTVGAEVEPLLQVNASAELSVSTSVDMGFAFGARMGQTAGNLSLSGTLPSGNYLNTFTLDSEQTFKLVLDKVSHSVTLRSGTVFEDELDYQLGVLTAQLEAGQSLSVLNYANTTFLIQSTGVKRLESVVTADFEALTGLGSDKTKAVLFTPVVQNLYFKADAAVAVTDINLEATLAVLEASSYGGIGSIALQAAAEFGTQGVTMTLSEIRDAVVEDPFSLVAANATISAALEVDLTVSVPGLASVTGGIAVALTPDFFVELKENFTLPNSSNFEVTINAPDLPSLSNFKNLSLAEIVVLIGDGVDLLFGNEEEGTTGLLSNLPLLDTEIPVVSFTPREVVTEVQEVLATIEGLLTDTAGSIHRLEDIVEEVLGLEDPEDDTNGCYKSCVVEFSYDSAAETLVLQLQYTASPTLPTLSLDLNLRTMIELAGLDISDDLLDVLGDFVDVEASLTFNFEAGASATLELGLDLSSGTPRAFIGGNTALLLEMQANATGSLTMSLGALEFGIEDGKIALDAGTSNSSDTAGRVARALEDSPGPAYFRYGLDSATKYYLDSGSDFSSIISGFSLTYEGGVSVELPLTGFDTMAIEISSVKDFMDRTSNSVSDLVVFKGATPADLLSSMGDLFSGFNPITAILTDQETLLKGINSTFDRIEFAITATDGVLGSLDVPVVGDKLREVVASNFIGVWRESLVTTVRSALEGLTTDDNKQNMATLLRTAMNSVFDTDFSILKDPIEIVVRDTSGEIMDNVLDDEGLILESALNSNALDDADAVEWRVALGKEILFDTSFDFDLGVDGLPLELDVSSGIELTVGWSFNLNFGVSVSKGFYLHTADTEMSVYATLKLPDLNATGELFILDARAENANDITKMVGRLAVDVTDKDGDDFLTFKELKSGASGLVRASAEFGLALGMNLTLGLANTEGMPKFTAGVYSYFGTSWTQNTSTGTAVGESIALPESEDSLSDQPVESGTVLLLDVGLDLGEFVTGVLKPIFAKLDGFLSPIVPILEALQEPLPVLSDMAGRDVSLLELPEVLLNGLLGAGGPVRGSVKNLLSYLAAIQEVVDLVLLIVDVISDVADYEGNLKISFGNWQVGTSGVERYTSDALPSGWESTARRARVLADSDDVNSDATKTGPSSMISLFKRLTDPDAVFTLPFLSASGVLSLITGGDVDLFVLQTPQMEIDVTIDFWFPIAAGLIVVDFYGSFQFSAQIAMGYDTSGIRRAIEQNNPALALDGFFLSDTDVSTGTGGVDIPELYSAGSIRVGATLNIGLAKLSGSGSFSFTGSIDLYDPNDDGKIRFSEIKSIIEEGSFLDIFNIKIKMCASASFSLDVFNPFVNWKCKWYGCWPRGRWESVYKFSASACFLELDTTPPALPVLAEVSDSTLRLNMGKYAGDREEGTTDTGEYFTIRYISGSVGSEEVEVLLGTPPSSGQNDNRQAQSFSGFVTYYAEARNYGDTILLENPVSRGSFDGGSDSGKDRLILDFSGSVSAVGAGTITSTSISGFGMSGDGITYSNFEEVYVKLPNEADTVTISSLPSDCALYLYLNGGNDKVTVAAGDAILGSIHIVGGSGQDTLVADAQSGPAVGSLTDTQVVGLGLVGALSYETMEVVRVELTGDADEFVVQSTPSGATSVEVAAIGGADVITIGSGAVNDVVTPVRVSGAGSATLVIDDELDTTSGNSGTLTASRISGLGLGASSGVQYSNVAVLEIRLALVNANAFEIQATTGSTTTRLYGGNQADALVISSVAGPTEVYGGNGTDTLQVPTTSGDAGTLENRIFGALLLDGGNGDDAYDIGFSGTGSSRINVSDSGYTTNSGTETNTLVLSGTDNDDVFLLRSNFIALVHSESAAERIDIDRSINGGITLNGHAGDDTFATDGTAGVVTQNGGAGDDLFLIGQLYNSERVVANMSEAGDAFTTTLTTAGYLSDGNSEQLNCNGESGEDSFVVMRNLGTLSLRGGVGNDRFTVRAFALADAEDDSTPDPDLGSTDVSTDEGDDTVYYTINAPVTIDGGAGFDTLVALGTDYPDTFVVTRNGIYGAGLYITFTGIEAVELSTEAGDDVVYVMSTLDSVQTNIYTGLGSDTVYVTPRYSVPVQSNDLRGHNGIVEHALTSAADTGYDGLETHGVTVFVADEDQASVVVVGSRGTQDELEVVEPVDSGSSGQTETYTVQLVHPITSSAYPVSINVVVPAAPSEIPDAASVTVSPNVLTFTSSNWETAQTVTVTVTDDDAVEGNEVVFLGHSVYQENNVDGYDALTISSQAVRVIDSDQAEMYVVEPADKTVGMRVSESGLGTVGATLTYDVLLRPCVSAASPSDVTVTPRYDTTEVTVSPASFSFSTASECRQTITVTAVDDADVEGFHFVAIYHDVSGGNAVFSASSLSVDTVNVEILDNDAPGLVVLESDGSTDVQEGGDAAKIDTYEVYLTKPPADGAEVSLAITVDLSLIYGSSAAGAKQVAVSPTSAVFTSANYYLPVTVTVSALADAAVDTGNTTQQFASQPALAYQIQGALSVGGAEAPKSVSLLKAVMYPGEVDLESYPGQENEWLTVREVQQVDTLVIENTGGYLATEVVVATQHITGMGMGADRVLGGEAVQGGIAFTDFEVVKINLGPATDTVVVNGSEAGSTVYVSGGEGDENFTVLAADGVVVLDGAAGADTFTFGDSDGTLTRTTDVVAAVGGEGVDTVSVQNTAGNPLSLSGTLTRTMLSGLGMVNGERGTGSTAVQLVAVRTTSASASPGQFTWTWSVSGVEYSLTFDYGASGATITAAMQEAVFPSLAGDTCGTLGTSQCAVSFAVDQLSTSLYLVQYMGELAYEDVLVSAIELDTSLLDGAARELAADGLTTTDVLSVTAGIVYADVESLDIDLATDAADALDIRGTSVPTVVRTHGGDDTVAVGSNALLFSVSAAQATQEVVGRMDYVEAALTIDMGETGRNRLLVSDSVSAEGRGAVVLSQGRISGLAPVDVVYTGSDFTRGITVWLGAHADTVAVTGTNGPDTGDAGAGTRTITALYTGAGADTVTVALLAGTDGFFVCGTEEGDDAIDASGSTLPLVLVGGTGADTIIAGLSGDIVLGDTGAVTYGTDTVGVPRSSTAAVSGTNAELSVVYTENCDSAATGGADTVTVSDEAASYVVLGGGDVDTITTSGGRDAVIGDFGIMYFTSGQRLASLETQCTSQGGDDVISTGAGEDVVGGGNGADTVYAGTGADVVLGDHGAVELSWAADGTRLVTSVASTDSQAAYGSADYVESGDGDDVVLGGAGADTVYGGEGADIVFGDHGTVASTVAGDFTFASSNTEDAAVGGGDNLHGDAGSDFLLGGQGDDIVYGGIGDDWIYGDHGNGSVTPSVGTLVYARALAALYGGADTLYGESGNNVIFGGHASDTVSAEDGSDVVFADYGYYAAQLGSAELLSVETESAANNENNVAAGAGNDYVFGGQGSDTLAGEAGADVIFGDHGHAVLSWDADTPSTDRAGHVAPAETSFVALTATSIDTASGLADVVSGGDGDDLLVGGAGADGLTGAEGADILFGDHAAVVRNTTGSGSTLVLQEQYSTTTSPVSASIDAVGSGDVLSSGAGDNIVFGGHGADTITSDSGADIVFGDFGDVARTTLSGGESQTTLAESMDVGYGGSDNITIAGGTNVVFAGFADDTVTTGDGADVVFGDHGNTTLQHTWGVLAVAEYASVWTETDSYGSGDVLHVGAGDNIVFGGQGADDVLSEDGADVVFGDYGSVAVSVAQAAHDLQSLSPAFGSGDIIVTNDGADIIFGGAANDSVEAGAGADIVFGDHGSVSRTGNATDIVSTNADSADLGGDDVLHGGEGEAADIVLGGQGADHVTTGSGDDTVFGDNGHVVIDSLGRTVLRESTASAVGGDDVVTSGSGADVVFGGAAADTLTTEDGADVVFGDHGSWDAQVSASDITIMSTLAGAEDAGGQDIISAGSGDDIAIGGVGGDQIDGGAGNDVLFGDSGSVVYDSSAGERRVTSTYTTSELGGADTIVGQEGDDFMLGQQGADTMEGNSGMDMMFGDHAEAVLAYATHSIVSARSTAPTDGLGSSDAMYGNQGEDYIFGGTGSDTLRGGGAADVILGDYGLFDSTLPLAHQYTALYTSDADEGGPDTIYGDSGDDIILGQQGADTIFGGDGEDDIIGGHDVLAGADGGDQIYGEGDADVVLGDNGVIDRTVYQDGQGVLEYTQGPPYANAKRWVRYAGAARYADVVRTVQRFDDVDRVAGSDTIDGGAGDDILHGQRGGDALFGSTGDDELFGEQGADVLHGGEGADVLLGDMGHVVRALMDNGEPRINAKNAAWVRNVVLEEQGMLTGQWRETGGVGTTTFTPAEAAALLDADLLVSLGGYTSSAAGAPKVQLARGWRTALAGVSLVEAYADELHGEAGDDILIGQRGDDTLYGGDGEDLLYGDSVSAAHQQDSSLLLATTVLRILAPVDAAETAALAATPLSIPTFGQSVHVPLWVQPEQASRAAALRPLDDSAVATVFGDGLSALVSAVGAGDFTQAQGAAVLRPFAAVVPDVVRHTGATYGNDILEGGNGNDLLVGDAALHTSLLGFHDPTQLQTLRERAAARWGEVQARLARMSADVGTYQEQAGTYTLPATATCGNDQLSGEAGSDTLVGDRLEAFTDVVYREELVGTPNLSDKIEALMTMYADFEGLAVDVFFTLYEAHHAVVQHLWDTRGMSAVAAPALQLSVSNDIIQGGDDDDIAAGDSLLLVMKGVSHDNAPEPGPNPRYFNRVSWSAVQNAPLSQLYNTLRNALDAHMRDDFNPTVSRSPQQLSQRAQWNRLPTTLWGNDDVQGDAGADTLVGDFALLAVTTFDGDHFEPTSPQRRQNINRAQDEHLDIIEDLLQERLTRPTEKYHVAELRDNSFDGALSNLAMYHNKGNGNRGLDEAGAVWMGDTLRGNAGEDALSGDNAVGVANVWGPTQQLLTQQEITQSSGFLQMLNREQWRRLEAYDQRQPNFDRDELRGGSPGEDDVLLIHTPSEDATPDREGRDLLGSTPGQYGVVSVPLRDSFFAAVQGTAVQQVALDGLQTATQQGQRTYTLVAGLQGLWGLAWGA